MTNKWDFFVLYVLQKFLMKQFYGKSVTHDSKNSTHYEYA